MDHLITRTPLLIKKTWGGRAGSHCALTNPSPHQGLASLRGLLPAPVRRKPSGPRDGISHSGGSVPAGRRGILSECMGSTIPSPVRSADLKTNCISHSWERQSQLFPEARASPRGWPHGRASSVPPRSSDADKCGPRGRPPTPPGCSREQGSWCWEGGLVYPPSCLEETIQDHGFPAARRAQQGFPGWPAPGT